MSSVASVNNPGMTYLARLLSSTSSPLLSSEMSSSQVQSVLQGSSPSDLVKLSDQALQLQNMDTLFGRPDTSETAGLYSAPSSSSSSAILQIIFATLSAASGSTTSNASGGSLQPSSGTATSSLASEIASYQSQLQTESIQALFGTGSTTGVSGTTLNVFG